MAPRLPCRSSMSCFPSSPFGGGPIFLLFLLGTLPPTLLAAAAAADRGGGGGDCGGGGGGNRGGGDRGGDRNRSAQVTNVEPDSALTQRWNRYDGTLRSLTTTLEPQPLADDGTSELCLSFHLRCRCNTDCRRKNTHRRATATETQRVDAYLTACGVAA